MEKLNEEQFEQLLGSILDKKLAELTKVDRQYGIFPDSTLSEKELLELPKEERIKKFFKAVLIGDQQVAKALAEGTDSAGGYLVPDGFRAMVIRELVDATALRNLATVIPVADKAGYIPKLAGNVSISWDSENTAFTETDPEFGQLQYVIRRMDAINYQSRELLADSKIDLTPLLVQLFAEAIGDEEEKVFMAGNGTTRPEGIRVNTDIGTLAQAGANLASDDLINLYYTLPAKYRVNSYFFIHNDIIKLVAKLKDADNRYLWHDPLDVGMPPTILGRPVIEQNDIPTTLGAGSNASEIILGVPKYYYVFDREQMGIEMTTVGAGTFEKHQAAIKVFERIDGRVALASAFKKLTAVK